MSAVNKIIKSTRKAEIHANSAQANEKKENSVEKEPVGLGSGKNPPQPSLKGGSNASSPPLEPVPNLIREGVRGDLQISVYSQDGKEVEKINLPPEIFGVKIKNDVIAQAVQAQLANARQSIAHTKDRSEVRGGGRKPWKQKGTGRARHGSRRSPIWIGGGVTHGPRNEKNFNQKINKKIKRQALLMVLSGKLNDKELFVVDNLKLQNAKTKEMAQIVKNLKLALSKVEGSKVKSDLDRGALIILPNKDETIIRASRNLVKIDTIGVDSLNVVDLLNRKYLVMLKDSVSAIKKIFVAK